MEENAKWTLPAYVAHNEALRAAEFRFQEERDRRYAEVTKAKEFAENNALQLAREIQVYKDEKANELREQINAERLLYVRRDDISSMESKYDAILKPLLEFVAAKQGSEKGVDKTLYYLIALIGVLIGAIGLLIAYFK